MKEKNKKKPDNKTFKIVLVVMAIFILLAVLSIGSCIYKILSNPENMQILKAANATDEEIISYSAYLDSNIDLKQRETVKYEDIIPQEIKEMQFDNYLMASEKYYELSRNSEAQGEDENLSDAYLAYGNYYAALSSKDEFANIMKVPKVSKMLAKAMIENDPAYKELRNNISEVQTETPAE
ncbi:MAG: hypothetical protein LBL00_03005 [Endomicrobium sp.]|jgi:hypothetical protein|nr:hypothetical protein [Endomicrobium sp.]